MITTTVDVLRHQLEVRRDRLQESIAEVGAEADLVRLLHEVDAALGRIGGDDYGTCLVCSESVSEGDLLANPLARYCLCDLSPEQQRGLERDLESARRIQGALLPDPDLRSGAWETHSRYEPAGPVSGDYCDVLAAPDAVGGVFFALGDVSGKGVGAALLMAHLHAAFRSLLGAGLSLGEIVTRVDRQLLAASIPSHFATLVCGRADDKGRVELVNAGHCLPLVARAGRVEAIAATGTPLGLFGDRPFGVTQVTLAEGDTLVLYSDGLSEARRADGEEFGQEGIERHLARALRGSARQTVRALRDELEVFLGGASRSDDLTILALRRRPAAH